MDKPRAEVEVEDVERVAMMVTQNNSNHQRGSGCRTWMS
jgi:hypothetical protein